MDRRRTSGGQVTTSAFPVSFLGVIRDGVIVSTERPDPYPVPPPHIHSRGNLLYRFEDFGGFDGREDYDVWADSKGRGIWIVRVATATDIGGTVGVRWQSLEQIKGALIGVLSTRKHIADQISEAPLPAGRRPGEVPPGTRPY